MRWTNVLSALTLLALATSQACAFTADDRFALRIDATRLSVMMDQGRNVLTITNFTRPAQKLDTTQESRAAIYENLVSAVLNYNVISHEVCEPVAVDASLCTGLYLPHWLNGRSNDFSDEQLRQMTDEASGKLMPVWDALCTKAKAVDSQTQACLIE